MCQIFVPVIVIRKYENSKNYKDIILEEKNTTGNIIVGGIAARNYQGELYRNINYE